MWSTAILELEIVPPNGANIVWEWHLWDHLVQDSDPSLPGYGVVSEHPELMDINYGDVGGGGGPGGSNADWMHINAIDYNPLLDQIVISSRHQNEIYIIDHSTTTEEASGHTGGNSGKEATSCTVGEILQLMIEVLIHPRDLTVSMVSTGSKKDILVQVI